jgi:Flp pilus assembly protein TadB
MTTNINPQTDTDKEKQEFFQYIERNEINSSRFILLGLLIIFINIVLSFFLFASLNGVVVVLIFVVTLVLPLFVINFHYRRCPKCGRPYNLSMPTECPQCHIRLKHYEHGGW